MKKLLFSLMFMVFAFVYLTGCKQDPSSSTSTMPMSANATTTAHPAWTFPHSKTVNGSSRSTIDVSDSDASNSAHVYTSSNSAYRNITATWSASGGSVSFVEQTTSGWGAYSIKSVDVSVSNGVAQGSNTKTIYSTALSDSLKIRAQAWCPASTNAKIAFIGQTPSGWGVYTVSTSGGTATKIFSTASGDGLGAGITWSNDGTQLAFVYGTGTNPIIPSIKVIDASTGVVNATLTSGYVTISSPIVWSHSGLDNIAFSADKLTGNHSADYNLYTIGTTSGSTETQIVNGYGGSGNWSPDNSELVFNDNAVTKKVTVATGATSTVGSGTPYGDWKKP
jgi:hypothetical protein